VWAWVALDHSTSVIIVLPHSRSFSVGSTPRPPSPLLALFPFSMYSLSSPSRPPQPFLCLGSCLFPRPPHIPHLLMRQSPPAIPHPLSLLCPARFGGRKHAGEATAALILHCGGIPHQFATSMTLAAPDSVSMLSFPHICTIVPHFHGLYHAINWRFFILDS
jgi:hypothetical protein